MRAGTLNSFVRVEYLTGVQDEAGQPVDEWVELASMWANIRNRSGAEAIRADQEASTVRTSIRVRWRADVCTGMQAVHNTTVFVVQSVLPQGREWLDLVCEVPQ